MVCIGNICRSPMAQAMLAAKLPHMRVLSAGLGALIGEPADAFAQQLMAKRGLDISAHRAQQVTSSLCQLADIILVMDVDQRRHLEALYPSVTGKVFTLAGINQGIPDPYQQSLEMFEHTFALIESAADAWIERIKRI